MIARDVTGFYAFFYARRSGHFLHIWGDFLTKLQKPWRLKGENIHWRKFSKKNPVETAHRNADESVPCRGQMCPEKHKIPKFFSLSPNIFELNIFETLQNDPLLLRVCRPAREPKAGKPPKVLPRVLSGVLSEIRVLSGVLLRVQ